MRYLAENPKPDRPDEIWLLSHKPVFTQGQAGKAEHVLNPGDIPVVQVDRGGQVTYHGPGQLVAYLLIDVRRRKLGVRNLVDAIERAVINALAEYEVKAATRPGAPGVYVNDAKIAALGLRIKNGWSYHGLSLNVNMDLAPFSMINPCGFEKLAVTQIADFVEPKELLLQQTSKVLIDKLLLELGYASYYS
ncbi:MAG: lipoyl(octanoyl) transferase LipB [Pseudomonadales bacterium]|nr:lipoyl(octanoyl) transferase LipB [Pseudomonadales bacterium]